MAGRVRFTITVTSLYDLVQQMEAGEVTIPAHQRDYCWSVKKQKEFIDTILEGTPTQGIIMRRVDRSGAFLSLEDGRQRLTTGQRFLNDEFSVPYQGVERTFSTLPVAAQQAVRGYQLSVTTYSNATGEQMVRIFDRFQNGEPLSIGERFHSMTEISPIVAYTKNMLMSEESPLFARVTATFGNRSGVDKRRKNLTNAMAIVFGLAFGAGCITKKWPQITEHHPEAGGSLLSRPFDQNRVTETLEQVLEIYEEVERLCPARGKSIKNTQWAVGKITGYIIHSLTKPDAQPFALVKRKWVAFLVGARADPTQLVTVLHADDQAARFWDFNRWEMGMLRVFDPAEAQRRADERLTRRRGAAMDPEEDDESSDSDE